MRIVHYNYTNKEGVIMGIISVLVLYFVTILALSYHNARLVIWDVVLFGFLLLATFLTSASLIGLTLLWFLTFAVLIPLNVPVLRNRYFIEPIFNKTKKMLPSLSETEEQAIFAGTVGWEGEIFKGNPDWKAMYELDAAKLTKEEQEFLDGPTTELCRLAKPWEYILKNEDSPPEVVNFIKDNGFMSFIIDKKYGGKQFSAFAQSEVQVKFGSRCSLATSYVGVPNSLGPAELLESYGTEEQKEYYLPRLAKGEEVPCFALTGPFAGSDAGAIPDNGIICKGKFNGKEIIGIKLNFKKRYITLAPVATLIGLAFKLYDPDHLIGDKEEYGITCALIPKDTKGVSIGRRHLPLRQAFANGPIEGKDVFIPLDYIIGGVEMAGKGWQMLVECLSVGRVISLPTSAATGAKKAAYATGLYARVRKQFGLPIGAFEGIQEALAKIAGFTFIIDSMRLFTLAAVGRGEKPSVPSAISKYHCTELGRKVGDLAMDVHGGKGIMMGPKNYLAFAHMGIPIAITVEGANILTRNMIIFGQGVTRCHPYLLEEMLALRDNDKEKFGEKILEHIAHTFSSLVRSIFLGLTDGLFVITPKKSKNMKRYVQKLTRYSSILAFVTDVTLLTLGGKLKRKESLSARLGDVLSMIYLGSAVLKRYEELGSSEKFDSVTRWSCEYLLYEAQEALHNLLHNYPIPWLGRVMKFITLPIGRRYHYPDDQLRASLAKQLMYSDELRDVLSKGIYVEDHADNNLAVLKNAVKKLEATSNLEARVVRARKEGKIDGFYFDQSIKDAAKEKIINKEEEKALLEAFEAMVSVISVDDFERDEIIQ